jgi:hypothetical protein
MTREHKTQYESLNQNRDVGAGFAILLALHGKLEATEALSPSRVHLPKVTIAPRVTDYLGAEPAAMGCGLVVFANANRTMVLLRFFKPLHTFPTTTRTSTQFLSARKIETRSVRT